MMTSLKLPKKKQKAQEGAAMPDMPDERQNPYGTSISFEKDTIAKVPGLSTLKGGEEITIMAKAKVTEVRIVDKDGSRDPERIEIQIQDIEISSDEANDFDQGFGEHGAKA